MTSSGRNTISIQEYFGMRLFFLTIPKPPCPLVPYVAGGSNSTRFLKKIIHSASTHVLHVFMGCAFPYNDIGRVASSFQRLSSGGDLGSRVLFARERGGGRNATAAKSLK